MDGTVVGWSWNFGDGATSALQNPTHQYSAASIYTVTLTVTDNKGATDNTSQNISVVLEVMQNVGPTDDASVWYERPNTNYGSHVYLDFSRTGDLNSWCYFRWSFLKFNLSSIPSGSQIREAKLNLYFDGYHFNPEYDPSIGVYEVSDDSWSEATITWNSKPGYGAEICRVTSLPAPGNWVTWDITSWAQDQFAGDKIVSVMGKPPYPDTGYYTTAETTFRSKEYSGYAPYLEVTYST